MLPQKIDQKKNGYPKKNVTPKKIEKWLRQKCWRTLLRGGLLLHFGKMAYFIAYGFINAIQTLVPKFSSIFDTTLPLVSSC